MKPQQTSIEVNFMDEALKKEEKRLGPGNIFISLLPDGPGEVYHNRLLIFPLDISKIALFSRFFKQPKWVLRVPLKVHYLLSENDDGEMIKQIFLCAREMTKIFIETLGPADNYFGTRCPLCEQVDVLWEQYNDRRKVIGLYKAKISKEEYIKRAQADDVLGAVRQKIKKYQPVTRFVFEAFDVDKFEGRKPLAEDEELSVQFLMVGKQVKDGIQLQVEAGHEFWDINKGLKVVVVSKDTRGGYTQDLILKSQYTVSVEPSPYKMPEELKQYLLSNPEIDFSGYIHLFEQNQKFVETEAGVGIVPDQPVVQKNEIKLEQKPQEPVNKEETPEQEAGEELEETPDATAMSVSETSSQSTSKIKIRLRPPGVKASQETTTTETMESDVKPVSQEPIKPSEPTVRIRKIRF